MSDNYTPIHNEVLEALCKINISPYEIRVLFCIWRKTYGFVDPLTGKRKKHDWISGSQITKMTGLDRRHVFRALKGLKDKNVIFREDKKTGFSKRFMKLMSSVEMTNDKRVVSKEMTGSASRDDKMSSVEAHTKETKETNTTENGIVVKITNWAYKSAGVSPSCTKEEFIRSVERAIERVGEDKIKKAYASEINAIQFLKNIKTL